MKSSLINNKKAAMEMSVGTIVTIVLLMTVLILGLVMVRTIFRGSIENINAVDQSVKNEINKLFSEDTSRQIVVYPTSRYVVLKKGDEGLGFGFSIRNVDDKADSFTYEITATEASCNMNLDDAEDLIVLGRTLVSPGREISPGSVMPDPFFIRFTIPQTTSPCKVRYSISVSNSDGFYVSSDVDLEIKSA